MIWFLDYFSWDKTAPWKDSVQKKMQSNIVGAEADLAAVSFKQVKIRKIIKINHN